MKTTKAFLNTTACRKATVFLAVIILMGLFASSSVAQTELTEQVQAAKSKTFFTQFIIAGGPIVWFILGPMSLLCSYLAIDACFCLRRKNLLPTKAINNPGPSDAQDLVSRAISNAAGFIDSNTDRLATQRLTRSANKPISCLERSNGSAFWATSPRWSGC